MVWKTIPWPDYSQTKEVFTHITTGPGFLDSMDGLSPDMCSPLPCHLATWCEPCPRIHHVYTRHDPEGLDHITRSLLVSNVTMPSSASLSS